MLNQVRVRPAIDTPVKAARSEYVGPIALALLIYAGQLKSTPALSWLSVDFTALCFGAVLLTAIISVVQQGPPSGRIVVPIVLFVIFATGVFAASMVGYSAEKVSILFSVALLLATAPFVLLRTPPQRQVFLVALVGIGLFTSVSTLLNGSLANEYSNRLTLEGATTILTAQMAGGAALVLFLAVFKRGLTPFTRIILLALTAGAAYVALASGSRGPVIAAAVGFVAVLIFSPSLRKYRVRAAVVSVLVVVVAVQWTSASAGDGFTRIFRFIGGEGDASTDARETMLAQGWQIASDNILGVGWGDYQQAGGLFAYPHNLLLEVLIEAGLFVAVIVVVYILVALVRAFQHSRDAAMLPFAALLVFALVNAMVSSDITSNRLLWVLLSVAFVVQRETRVKT